MVAFDISAERDDADEVDDGGTSSPPDRRPGWWSRAGDRWRRADRRQRRLVAGVSGGAALVLVGGVAATAAVVSHAHDERLRAAPGGVLSLDGELTEVWRSDAGGLVLAVLPDGGVVQVEGEDVVATDAGSGTERWRVALGAEPACGPQPRFESSVEWTMPSELVTCLHGPVDERAVAVVDATGDVVGQRQLPAAEYGGEDRDVVPAADGGLLVVEHDTDVPAVRDYPSESAARAAVRDIDPGEAAVRVEDALTGDLRFEVPTSEHSGRLTECVSVWDRSDGAEPFTFDQATPFRLEISPDRWLTSTPAVVGYQWCDVHGVGTTEGMALGGSTGEGVSHGVSSIMPFPGGGYLVPHEGRPGGMALLADDGSVRLGDTSSSVLAPQVSLAADRDVVLATAGYQVLVGLDGDGEELWRHEVPNPQVMAQAAGVVVFAADDDLVAVDLQDGSERWRVVMSDLESGVSAWPTSAVTDGERLTVALAVHSMTSTSSAGLELTGELVTVDLATGAVTRTALDLTGMPYLAAVDGRLLLQEIQPADGPDDVPASASVRILAPR